MKKKTIIGFSNRKPYISLEEALNKIYEINPNKAVYRNGKRKGQRKLNPLITVPQILIGHKVKLVLVE